MITIRGVSLKGSIVVALEGEKVARLVQDEMPFCVFVATCGCGQFHRRGKDGVAIFREAQGHFASTGHRCFGHFLLGESAGGGQ